MDYTITHNENRKRFEISADGKTAYVKYDLFDGGIAYMHTIVPSELEGKGIASALAKYVLDYAADNNLKVKPYCPFINAYIDKHPEYQANSLFHTKIDNHGN